MELYIIMGLLGVLILLVLILLIKSFSKKTNELNIVEKLGKFETTMTKDIGEFKVDFSRNLRDDFDKLNERIEQRLEVINNKVNERLDVNFEKTNKTFENVLQRLTKIDEAQKKIDGLSSEIVSLQSVLTDKKTRGIFGEVNLNYILTSVFGENNNKVYEIQHLMPNKSMVDAILYAPKPLGTIGIDSKFPLENYQKMTDKSISSAERLGYEKLFKADVKKHIDAIASKYIIDGYTSNQAIMFLPAEAIFAEINAYHEDLLKYAYNKRVWITSPTTLMSTLSIIQMILKNMERDKYAKVIHVELGKLSDEFARYRVRWDKLSKNIESVNNDIKDINITTDKITKRFDAINKVDIKSLENKDIEE